jgi:hypothetical protein
LVLGAMTAVVAAGLVSLPALAGVTAVAGVLGTLEVLGLRARSSLVAGAGTG